MIGSISTMVRQGSALAVVAAVVVALTGATADAVASAKPLPTKRFDLIGFFDGTSYSKGTVTTALVSTSAFTAKFSGKQSGHRLRLDENFTFKDGKRLQRWDLAETAQGRVTGTVTTELQSGKPAPTVPVTGRRTADGAVLDYDGYAPGGGNTVLHFHHAMTARADGTVANHVTVSKYYLPLATSDVTFAKSLAALARY